MTICKINAIHILWNSIKKRSVIIKHVCFFGLEYKMIEKQRFTSKYFPNINWTGEDWEEWKSIIQDRSNHRMVILLSNSCIGDDMVMKLDDIAKTDILTTLTQTIYPMKTVYDKYTNLGSSVCIDGAVLYHVPSGKLLLFYLCDINVLHYGDYITMELQYPILRIVP